MANKRINLDAVFKTAQLGLVNKSISQTLAGMRTGHRRLLTPSERVNHGYVFMTKPQLNLTSNNISRYRPFIPLLSPDPHSMAAWIRCTLDPRFATVGNEGLYDHRLTLQPSGKVFSSQVDTRSPFINVVTNALTSMSGFPDIEIQSFTSDPNRINASFQMVDGIDNLNMPVDLTLTFKDMIGAPITNLFRTLAIYPTQLYQGVLQRYPDFIAEDCMDYNVRIFKFGISPDGEHIHSIASTYPGFVQGAAVGQNYDYNIDTPYDEDSMVSFRFTFSGVVYEDPVLLDDFNMIMRYANPNMRESKPGMVKIPRSELEHFSYEQVYPWVNIDNYKLEWYTSTATYKRIKDLLTYFDKSDNAPIIPSAPLPPPGPFGGVN